MKWLAGSFLIAHAVVHLAVWATPGTTAQPFDSCRSWLAARVGVEDRARALAAAAAVAATVIFTIAGIGVIADAGWAPWAAVVGAAVSLLLTVVYFHPLADVQRRHQRGDHRPRRSMSPKVVKRLAARSRSR